MKTRSKRMRKKHTTMKRKRKRKRIYSSNHYNSGDGMLTSVWGPSLWHFLHLMSFNYPVNPTHQDKKHYRDFIASLQYVLPCGYCRENFRRNMRMLPLTYLDLKNRSSFSKYIYNLHEVINNMLGKKSELNYMDMREQYEHFRSRCTKEKTKQGMKRKTRKRKKEKGCTEPLYGKKSKCIIKIVPQSTKCKTFQMDKRCIKKY